MTAGAADAAERCGACASGRNSSMRRAGQRAGRTGFLAAGDRGRRRSSPGIGLTVTKKTGNSPERNRIKRRLRAAARACGADFQPQHDYVLVGRREALTLPFAKVVADLSSAIAKVHATPRDPGTAETMNETNRNMIIAIVLSVVVLFGWQFFVAGPQMERAQQQAQIAAAAGRRRQSGPRDRPRRPTRRHDATRRRRHAADQHGAPSFADRAGGDCRDAARQHRHRRAQRARSTSPAAGSMTSSSRSTPRRSTRPRRSSRC